MALHPPDIQTSELPSAFTPSLPSTSSCASTVQGLLDYDPETFRVLLLGAVDAVTDLYRQLPNRKAYPGHHPAEVYEWFNEPLPQSGQDPLKVLEDVRRQVLDTATMNITPDFYAYVMSCGTPIGMVAELLAAAINQNGGKWHLAPALSEIEKRVVQWGADFIGFRGVHANATEADATESDDISGILVSGGSAANLTCLTVARRAMTPPEVREKGYAQLPQLTAYTSAQVHGCMDKSFEQMGIGTHYLRKISTKRDYTVNVAELVYRIEQDIQAGHKPFCIIANAGTVNTGAIDPIDKLADVAEQYGLWLHVDGAYGGLAAAVAEQRKHFTGLHRADSIAVDFHKWLYVPFEAGCAMFRQRQHQHRTFYHHADYLATDRQDDGRVDLNEYGFQLSRNFKALKVWMTFKAYGAERLRAAIADNIETMTYLAQQVAQSPDFHLSAPPSLSIVCFQYLGQDPVNWQNEIYTSVLNKHLVPALEADGRVFITGTQLGQQTVLRACCVNHRTTQASIDKLLSVIREVGEAVVQDLRQQTT